MEFGALFFSFQGRISRMNWWVGLILLSVILGVVGFIFGFVGAMISPPGPNGEPSGLILALTGLIYLVALWPSLAIGIKRFHDRNKSGWWLLITLIPIIGGLWYLIECGFLKGTDGANRFGDDPLAGKIAAQAAG